MFSLTSSPVSQTFALAPDSRHRSILTNVCYNIPNFHLCLMTTYILGLLRLCLRLCKAVNPGRSRIVPIACSFAKIREETITHDCKRGRYPDNKQLHKHGTYVHRMFRTSEHLFVLVVLGGGAVSGLPRDLVYL